jgi:hypothetical protein
MWMLVDRKTGKRLGITLETEDELRQGDDALNAMVPAAVPSNAAESNRTVINIRVLEPSQRCTRNSA